MPLTSWTLWPRQDLGKSQRQLQSSTAWADHNISKDVMTCVPRAKVKKAPCGRPIISSRFLQRLQMDLIDFTSQPDGDMKWILHLRDHFTKYSWGCALPNKQAVGVATKLKTTFCMFGAPEILQVLSYVF